MKSGSTAEAAALLALHLPPDTPVLSLQNGVANPAVAKAAAPGLAVIPGMVGFNVVRASPGRWHRGTWGELAAEAHGVAGLAADVAAAGLPLALHADLKPVQWGKLLLNLNNPVNALSRPPQLSANCSDHDLRCVTGRAHRRHPAKPARSAGAASRAPPRLMPPTCACRRGLFRLATRQPDIDDRARTSVADLARSSARDRRAVRRDRAPGAQRRAAKPATSGCWSACRARTRAA
ncbi:MAG: 2-dehydropantoate 2-reductase N-terminal domain-containing protein [Rubrivivax sp.]